jgi:alpha-galactosidase
VLDHVLPHPRELRPGALQLVGGDRLRRGRGRPAQARGARSSDTAGLGDWQSNPGRFPDGLGPLVEEVHRLGMAFGLRVEPEMVDPDSELYRRHPEWILHYENRERTLLRSQSVLNFARLDVAEWAHGWLDRLVGEHGVDFLKWDMNRTFSEAGWPSDNTDSLDRLTIQHGFTQLYPAPMMAA